MQEREAASQLFKGKKGVQLARDIGKRAKTFTPGAPVGNQASATEAPAAAAASSANAKQNIEAIKVTFYEDKITLFISNTCVCEVSPSITVASLKMLCGLVTAVHFY